MKQVLQELKTGAVIVADAPEPAPATGRLLVRVQASLLSAGTESAQLAKGRQSLLTKIREKPHLVRRGLEVLRDRGLAAVREQVASKYEGYAELGYSCAGIVTHSGDGTGGHAPGTLVACAGVGAANHAEFVSVPLLLTAQGAGRCLRRSSRLHHPRRDRHAGSAPGACPVGRMRRGDRAGAGWAAHCPSCCAPTGAAWPASISPPKRGNGRWRAAATSWPVPNKPSSRSRACPEGFGADAVIICAATTESSPVELAGKIARSRGRVVMVGATGMTVPREDYYLKELSFTLSRSYGTGRYDRRYEEEGQDYPVDYGPLH